MQHIGKFMHEFEELGVQVLNSGPGVILISVPERAPNGMIPEELAEKFSRVLNKYVSDGKVAGGVIQVHHTVRRNEEGASGDNSVKQEEH